MPPSHLIPDAVVARARTFLHLLYAVIGLSAVIAVLWQFDETRSIAKTLIASGGLIAVVIGLAVQGTLGNVVAGVVLTFAEPVRVGDHVKIGEHSGTVQRIGVSYTRISIADGTHVEFPNSLLAQHEVVVLRDPPPSHKRDGGTPA